MDRPTSTAPEIKMTARNVNVFYGDKQAIKDVSIDVDQDHVTDFIGPSGCGKSTFLRTLTRMNDTVESARVEGDITLDGADIYGSSMDVLKLPARLSMRSERVCVGTEGVRTLRTGWSPNH